MNDAQRNLLKQVAIGLLVLAAFLTWRAYAIDTRGLSDDRVGQPAAEFTLMTSSGEEISLSDFSGKPVLIDFWSLWCGPCYDELRHLDELATNLGDEATIISIIVDLDDAARDQRLSEFESRNELAFPVLLDTGYAQLEYHVDVTPTLVLVDSDGQVARVFEGVVSARDLERAVRELIDG